MRTLTDEEKEKLMNEIIESINDRHTKHDYEVTIQEFADKCGMSYGFAKQFLRRQVLENKMTKRQITMDGQSFTVYSVI